MIIAGGMRAKLVLYPISNQTQTRRDHAPELGGGSQTWRWLRPAPPREDWNRLGQLDELLPYVEGVFHLPLRRSRRGYPCHGEHVYEYPMCDRDPLRAGPSVA